WAELWGIEPHARIGRKMLEKSLEFKIRERNGQGLSAERQARLDQLVRQYKRNPKCFDENQPEIKPGTKIVRSYKGVQHSVLVQSSGYKYKDKNYTSLSQIATEITGVRRNGWEFFN